MVSFGTELSSLFRVEEQSAPTVILTCIEAVEQRGEGYFLQMERVSSSSNRSIRV